MGGATFGITPAPAVNKKGLQAYLQQGPVFNSKQNQSLFNNDLLPFHFMPFHLIPLNHNSISHGLQLALRVYEGIERKEMGTVSQN